MRYVNSRRNWQRFLTLSCIHSLTWPPRLRFHHLNWHMARWKLHKNNNDNNNNIHLFLYLLLASAINCLERFVSEINNYVLHLLVFGLQLCLKLSMPTAGLCGIEFQTNVSAILIYSMSEMRPVCYNRLLPIDSPGTASIWQCFCSMSHTHCCWR